MPAKKLLVADDSLTIQKVIRLALSGSAAGTGDGYEIQAVSDGNDAIQQISLFRPDIVLIDVSLPGKSAFEVKRAINEHRDLDSVRFVLMSSAFEKVDEDQVNEVRFHGRLTKPFDPAHLREVLSDVLAQQQVESSSSTMFLTRPESAGQEPELPPPPPSGGSDFDLPPPLPSFSGVPSGGGGGDTDIKNLTESTIRMSGLDDFNWSVQEPSLKPSSAMLDTGNSDFPMAPPRDFPPGLELSPPPPPPMPEIPLSGSENDSSDFPPSLPPAMTANSADMEKMIRAEVEKALRKMTQEMLSDTAERIIKQEIHRMLLQQPGP